MNITIAQSNPTVGDIRGNLSKILGVLSRPSTSPPDLIIFPELFLVGYPPKDLLERTWFIEKTRQAIQELTQASVHYPETGIIVGAPVPTGRRIGKSLYNSALLIYGGEIILSQNKSLLPTYDVFDETRHFEPAPEIHVVSFKDEKLGISICEDFWNDPETLPRGMVYTFDPIEVLAKKGATLFINISASPFYVGKETLRFRLIRNHCQKHRAPFIFVNQVGGNDDLIYDGRSMFLDREGEPVFVCDSFKEHIHIIDTGSPGRPELYRPQDNIESVYEALVLGIKDYIRKCGFANVVVGLSGGIDSAVTCCLAREAIGSEHVLSISMPSPYSSVGSIEDSRRLAAQIGIEFKVIPISEIYSVYLKTLKDQFAGREADTAEENIQARIRGNILMAFSNKFGHLLLSTGNKSELAMGYCTLYGDMSGGLAVLADVPKTMVYELARYINRRSEILPREIIEKPPSAELRLHQCDQDTLPPYPVLDQVLSYYIEELASVEEIIKLGYDPETVRWISRTVDSNEYKRNQAAPSLKVTSKAFGVGRRMPLAAKYDI